MVGTYHRWALCTRNSPNPLPETAHPRRQRLLDCALVQREWMLLIEPGLLLHVRRGLATGYDGCEWGMQCAY